ncbi:MAG: O-acetyl-ADP-ribose deacetylase [Alphaproteobacteria bacterium]|nr:MAG: O-acetyl-ADP-ribose deacetylase [Alphaproteobacteria bacterium]
MSERIEIVAADITKLELDAIVNAANTSLVGGGGVDGAIHRAAGPELGDECRALGGCSTGEAKITKGHGLPADWVIHTVGPVWHGGKADEDQLLAGCYRNSLELARQHRIRSIAFPSISTGAYRFPSELAAKIAIETVTAFLETDDEIQKVVFCCFGEDAAQIYRSILYPRA